MIVTIAPIKDLDVEAVIANSEIAGEPWAVGSLTKHIAASANVWVGKLDGDIAAVWGVVPQSTLSDRGYLWMRATKVVDRAPTLLIRWSRPVMQEMIKHYEALYGYCNQEVAIRWLKMLGAEFGKETKDGVPFVIRRV